MQPSEIVDMASSFFGVFGTLFFCVGVLEVRSKDLVWLAIRMWGAGEQLAINMRAQQVDFGFGIFFIFASFALHLLGNNLSHEQSVSGLCQYGCSYVFGFLGLIVLVTLLCWYLLRRASKERLQMQIQEANKANQ